MGRAAIHGHDHRGCIIQIGIMGVGVLKGPAPGPHIWALIGPVAHHIEHLQGLQPFESGQRAIDGLGRAHLHQRVADQRRVPDRRETGLAIDLVFLHDQQLFDRRARDGHPRIAGGIAQHVEHHHRIGHGREDRTQAILTVQAFDDEGDRLVDGLLARAPGKPGLDDMQHGIQHAEDPGPGPDLTRPLGPTPHLFGGLHEKLGDGDAPGIARPGLQRHQHQQGHQHRSRPIGDLGEMKGKP